MSRLSIILFMVAIMAVSGIQIAHADSIPIPVSNASFEEPVFDYYGNYIELGEGDYIWCPPCAITIPAWSPGKYGTDETWHDSRQVDEGVMNPDSWTFTGGAAEGENTAFVWLSSSKLYEGVSQVLGDTLKADMEYVLRVQVGYPSYNVGTPPYRLELLAGRVLLGSYESYEGDSPGSGLWELHSIIYTYNPDLHLAQLGEKLEVRLSAFSGIYGNFAGDEVHFDNVTLTATAPPNTPDEQDVTVDLGSGVTVTFDNVTKPGYTTVATSDTPPGGSFFINFIPPFYEISTTAVFTGDVRIELNYAENDFDPLLEPFYRLFHFEGSPLAAVDITDDTISDNPNTEANKIIGVTNSFSTFAVGYEETQNQPPIANAGSDQAVEQENYDGAEVTLDGSGSTDPDSTPDTNDDIVSFEWYEGDTLLGSGETLNYTFSVGEHNVTLIVTDSQGLTGEDEVMITIEPWHITVTTEKAKVCWHHDDLHVEGKMYFPEGVWKDTLSPVGSAEVTLAGVEVPDQVVVFEVKGGKSDKWEYKNKKNDLGNIKEFKIDWKEKAPKFDYHGDDKFHIHTHTISGAETTLCIHTGEKSGVFTVSIEGITIEYGEFRSITVLGDVTFDPQKIDNSHVHFNLPFQLTPEMTIIATGAIGLSINVADYYERSYVKFKLVSAFDPVLLSGGPNSSLDELQYVISLGNLAEMISGSNLIGDDEDWTKQDDKHWEYKPKK